MENSLPPTGSVRSTGEPAEWRALLECASPYSPIEQPTAFSLHSIRWPEFLQLAEHHGLIALLAERVKSLDPSRIPQQARVQLSESRRLHALLALRLTAELFSALQRFADENIEILVTKGPALSARCYGEPGMRQYVDIDLVVRERDIRRATQAMVNLNYEPRVPLTAIDAKRIPGEYVFRKSSTDLSIEFHTERTFRYHPRRLPIEKVFERRGFVTVDGREIPALSVEDELVLICTHGAKHFWERLMWIADVAALISRQSPDWDRAKAIAGEVGAERILRLGLCLASDLLNAELPAPIAAAVRSDRVVARLADKIEARLASAETHSIGILERAAFRTRMRDSWLSGLAYLLRLALSPTEEDWSTAEVGSRPAFVEALSRPFRLAKKHGRRSK